MRAAVAGLPPIFRGLALPQGGEALGDLAGGQAFDVGGDGLLVSVGVCDAGEAVVVEPVGGFGDGRFNRCVNPAALDSVVWAGLR